MKFRIIFSFLQCDLKIIKNVNSIAYVFELRNWQIIDIILMIFWGTFVSFDIFKNAEEEVVYGKWGTIIGLYQ